MGYKEAVQSLSGLVGYWRLGEPSGTSAVDLVSGNNGTYVNSPTLGATGLLTGDADTAVAFVAASLQRVNAIPDAAALRIGDTFTIIGWASGNAQGYIYNARSSGAGVRLDTTNRTITIVKAGVSNVFVTGSNALPATGSHMVAAWKNGASGAGVYVDAAAVSGTFTNATMDGTAFAQGPTIGASYVPSSFFNGTLDEVAVFNRVLTSSEIAFLWAWGTHRVGTGSITSTVTLAGAGFKKAKGTGTVTSTATLAGAGALYIRPRPGVDVSPNALEAWITDLSGSYLGDLERSATALFRNLTWSIERNKPGAASYEYHRDNSEVARDPRLAGLDSLLWIKFRGATRVFILEQKTMQLDAQENSTGWYRVAGRGVLQLLGDRLVWPEGFTGNEQPDEWTDQWRTIASMHAGSMLWDLIDETNPRFPTQISAGTIETTPGDEWTQQFRFDTLLDVTGAVTAALGDVDMDGLTFSYYNTLGTDRSATVILEEGADVTRAARDTSKQASYSWIIAEGVGEGVFAKIATAEDVTAARRREAYLDAKDAANLDLLQLKVDGALDEVSGAIDRIGLDLIEDDTGSDWLGIDGRYQALRDFTVGDWVRAIVPDIELDEPVRIVALYFAEQDDRVIASMDVNDQRTEALILLDEGNESTARSIGVKNRMPQGQLVPYSLGPWSGPFDTDVAAQFFFTIPARIFLLLDVILKVRLREFQSTSRNATGTTSGASSASTTDAGGSQTPTSSSGGSQTPTSGASSASTTDDGGGQTKTSSSGGGSTPTSGSSSASTTSSAGPDISHRHAWALFDSGTDHGLSLQNWTALSAGGGSIDMDLAAAGSADLYTEEGAIGGLADHDHGMAHTHDVTISAHTHTVTVDDHHHGMAHTHTVTIAAHTHTVTIAAHSHGMSHTHTVPTLDLLYGMYQETIPASWSVTPKVYSVSSGGSLTLVHTFDPITDAVEELDLTAYVDTAGDWMLELQSDSAQPNNGRLMADIYGAATGAISSAR